MQVNNLVLNKDVFKVSCSVNLAGLLNIYCLLHCVYANICLRVTQKTGKLFFKKEPSWILIVSKKNELAI